MLTQAAWSLPNHVASVWPLLMRPLHLTYFNVPICNQPGIGWHLRTQLFWRPGKRHATAKSPLTIFPTDPLHHHPSEPRDIPGSSSSYGGNRPTSLAMAMLCNANCGLCSKERLLAPPCTGSPISDAQFHLSRSGHGHTTQCQLRPGLQFYHMAVQSTVPTHRIKR